MDCSTITNFVNYDLINCPLCNDKLIFEYELFRCQNEDEKGIDHLFDINGTMIDITIGNYNISACAKHNYKYNFLNIDNRYHLLYESYDYNEIINFVRFTSIKDIENFIILL